MRLMVWYSSIAEELDEVDSIISGSLLSINNPELNGMCENIMGSGGKKIRPAVCILSHLSCNGTNIEKTLDVAAAFELIHNATLIHDDINDHSEIRRGRKALHKEHTVSKAIVTGDLLFALGFKLVGTATSMVIDAVVDASMAMADSEFVQKDLEHTPSATEDDYIRIITGKTARPIQASAKVGAVLANASEEMSDAIMEYSLKVGLAFQIIDDLLDVIGDPKVTGKAVGADLMEGKPTMPVIFAMQDPVHGERMKAIFSKDEITDDDISEALSIISGTDAVQRSREKAEKLMTDALNALSAIPDSVYKESMIQLAEYIIGRDR